MVEFQQLVPRSIRLKTRESAGFVQSTQRTGYKVWYRYLILFTCVLLLIAASRITRLSTLEMDLDEIWTGWQTLGTPAEIVAWTPYDWSPLSYLIFGAWRGLTGISPFTMRLLPVFVFLISMALLYRIVGRLFDERAAVLAIAACAALGYSVHISLLLRGYIFLFALVLLAWWLAIRYFNQPSAKRGILLGLVLAAMFYIHVSSIFAMAMVGVYTLVMYRRAVWRWWLPGIVAAPLAAPEVLSKFSIAAERAGMALPLLSPWFTSNLLFTQLSDILHNFAGESFEMWAALVCIAVALVLGRYSLQRRVVALLLWMLAPLAFMVFSAIVGSFNVRQFAWALPGFAVCVGCGFAQLPRAGRLSVLGVLAVVMLGPVPITVTYKHPHAPLVGAFTWMRQQYTNGDVILVDPNYQDVLPEEWDYFTRAYFPEGITFAKEPGQARRVFYIFTDGHVNVELIVAAERGRANIAQFGTAAFLIRLYEMPPDAAGVLFQNGLRFHGITSRDLNGPILTRHEGETVHIRLWWSIDQTLPLDYSVGTYIMRDGQLLAEFNGPPQLVIGPRETSRWEAHRLYFEDRQITLPNPLPTGDLDLNLAVYNWQDGKRISAPGVDKDNLLNALRLTVKAW